MQDIRTDLPSAYRIAKRRAERRKRIRRRRIMNAIVFALLVITFTATVTLIAKDDTGNATTQCTPLRTETTPKELPLSKSESSELEVIQTLFTAGEMEETAYTEREVELIAKTVYGEALVTQSDTEMAAVVWCILNRVDADDYGCGHSIEYVVTFNRQFHGYNEDNPVTPHIKELVIDVLDRWMKEKDGQENVGRVLPKEYRYFEGDGLHNHYATEYGGTDYWDWSLESPYES